MGLTEKEMEKFEEFCEFSGKNVSINSFDGIQSVGKLVNIENPLDVDPEYPMFMIKETPDSDYLIGIYLNQIKDIKLA